MRPLISLFVMLGCLLPTLPAAAGLSVSPVVIHQRLDGKGGGEVLEFVIANSSSHAMEIDLSASPLFHDIEGAPRDASNLVPLYDISDRIDFNEPRFVLDARRWRRVRATVDRHGASGSGHAFVYARGVPVVDPNHSGVVSAVRVGVVVNLVFPGTAEVRASVEAVEPRPDGLRVVVRNAGDVYTKPAGSVRLLTSAGDSVWEASIVPANVFPRLARALRVAGPPITVPSGRYVLEIGLSSPRVHTYRTEVEVRHGSIRLPTATP